MCVCWVCCVYISCRRDWPAGPLFFLSLYVFFLFYFMFLSFSAPSWPSPLFLSAVSCSAEWWEEARERMKSVRRETIFPKMGEGRSIMQDGCRVAWRRRKKRERERENLNFSSSFYFAGTIDLFCPRVSTFSFFSIVPVFPVFLVSSSHFLFSFLFFPSFASLQLVVSLVLRHYWLHRRKEGEKRFF